MGLGAKILCPGAQRNEEQSCELSKAGVRYGVSDGLVVSKQITANGYSERLPFDLTWREKLEKAVQKIENVTKGKPPLFIGVTSDGYYLSTDHCLASKNGSYTLTLSFDKSGGLVEVSGQILYP